MLSLGTTVASLTNEIAYPLINETYTTCVSRYRDTIPTIQGPYCNWTWDKYLCWPPTPANQSIRRRCPKIVGFDAKLFVERKCDDVGQWAVKPNATRQQFPNGWKNYERCYTEDMQKLLAKLGSSGNEEDINRKIRIAENTRLLEIVGLCFSLIALIASLIIFCNIRSLQNARTKIHINLIVAMIVQVLIRLTLYIDLALLRNAPDPLEKNSMGIQNMPYLCEASYSLLEYARTSMFMWMFIEGLYLNSLISISVFQANFPYAIYTGLGWGLPLIMTIIWAVFTAYNRMGFKCWWGYNLTPVYWILEGPRMAMLIINSGFLANITRVLIIKLRRTHTSKLVQIRKASRGTLFLVPLLGVTTIFNMIGAPLDKSALEFALWSYPTHFLTAFQGLFIAICYCFLNNEVQTQLMKNIRVYMTNRGHTEWNSRRNPSTAYAFAADVDQPANHIDNRNLTEQRNKYANWILVCFEEKVANGKSNAPHQTAEAIV